MISFPIISLGRLCLHHTHQRRLPLLTQSLLHKLADSSSRLAIRLSQVLSAPLTHILNLRPRVLWSRLASVQSREAHAEADILDVTVFNDGVVGGGWQRWVDEKLKERFASE